MKIKREENFIIVKFPAKKDRINPYMSDENVGEMPNLIAMVADDEWGLAKRIDRAYKGKSDDVSRIIVHCETMDKEDFIEGCKDAGLGIVNYEEQE